MPRMQKGDEHKWWAETWYMHEHPNGRRTRRKHRIGWFQTRELAADAEKAWKAANPHLMRGSPQDKQRKLAAAVARMSMTAEPEWKRESPKKDRFAKPYMAQKLNSFEARFYRAAGVLPWCLWGNGNGNGGRATLCVLLGAEYRDGVKQLNFLGGKREVSDANARDTAWREAFEESANLYGQSVATAGHSYWYRDGKYCLVVPAAEDPSLFGLPLAHRLIPQGQRPKGAEMQSLHLIPLDELRRAAQHGKKQMRDLEGVSTPVYRMVLDILKDGIVQLHLRNLERHCGTQFGGAAAEVRAAAGAAAAGAEERRYDPSDGSGPFTRNEFCTYYGPAVGLVEWARAMRAMPARQVNVPPPGAGNRNNGTRVPSVNQLQRAMVDNGPRLSGVALPAPRGAPTARHSVSITTSALTPSPFAAGLTRPRARSKSTSETIVTFRMRTVSGRNIELPQSSLSIPAAMPETIDENGGATGDLLVHGLTQSLGALNVNAAAAGLECFPGLLPPTPTPQRSRGAAAGAAAKKEKRAMFVKEQERSGKNLFNSSFLKDPWARVQRPVASQRAASVGCGVPAARLGKQRIGSAVVVR